MAGGSDRHAEVVRRQRGAVGRLDRDPFDRRVLRPRALQGRRRPAPRRTRSSSSATSPAGRCSTCSATSGSTRCRGRGSGRASPGRTSRRPPSSSRADRSPTSSASRTRASSSRTCTTCPTSSTATFDVVYTSRGVLGWLPDIRGWARVVAHFLAPGGAFFITETHPVAQVVRERGRRAGRAPARPIPYWEHHEPLVVRRQGLVRGPGRRRRRADASMAGTTASARSSPR